MMRGNPRSISTADLGDRVTKAVSATLQKYPAFGSMGELTFFPDHGLVGYILDSKYAAQPASELASLTSEIGTSIGDMGRAASIVVDGNIIMGFFPVDTAIPLKK